MPGPVQARAAGTQGPSLRSVFQLALFVAVELLLLPVQTLAVWLYTLKLWAYNLPKRISGTANEPFFARLLMHVVGTRPDPAAAQLAPHLPSMSWLIAKLVESWAWPSLVSGYDVSMFRFPAKRPTSMATFVSQRTEFFDRELEKAVEPHPSSQEGAGGGGGVVVQQVVILGAGWDTRTWSSLSASQVRVWELDAPPTSSAKCRAVARAGLDTSRVTFVPCDFATTSWLDALSGHGFNPAVPTFVLWEGVTPYLPGASVKDSLAAVAKLAPGSRIAFDFYAEELINCKPPFQLTGWGSIGLTSWFYGEKFLWGLPTTSTGPPVKERVERFLQEQGLTLEKLECMGPDELAFGGVVLASA